MAEDRSTIILPDNSQHPGYAYPAFGGFGNGFGSFNSIADLFGLAIIASMFGWGNNGFGGFGGGWGGGAGTAGFLSNQLNNDSGRELIMNAINAQGEASRTAVSNLATALGQDFNLVNSGVQNVQNALQTLALQQAVYLYVEVQQRGEETLEHAEIGQADRNTAAVTAAIAAQTTMINDKFCDLEKREMQSKINTQAEIIGQLRGQIDNANQTAAITSYVNSLVTPLSAKVDQIAAKQLPTVNVQWPQLQAINTTPYVSGGIYGAYGYGYGNNGLVF